MKVLLFNPLLILLVVFPNWGQAQLITVSGYVTHYLTGKALENVTIFDSASGIGTISDKNGFYKLMLTPGKLDLVFSETGFKSLTEQFTSVADTVLMISLKPDRQGKSHSKTTNPDLQVDAKNKEKAGQKRKLFTF